MCVPVLLPISHQLGVSPNVSDYDKRTPLHLAASEGHLECVQLLLSHWADVNAVDRMGGTVSEGGSHRRDVIIEGCHKTSSYRGVTGGTS